jgi:hypothetical protein
MNAPNFSAKCCFALLSLSLLALPQAGRAQNTAPDALPAPSQPSLNVPEMQASPSGEGLVIARAKENFAELTLKGSELKAFDPLLGSREVRPTFTRELLQVRWRPNDPIDLYVVMPVGVKNPPVVLYLYGFPTDTDRFKNDAWCERVTQSGAAAVGFVSALTGQRYNFRPFKENFISELPEALTTSVHDIPMVLNYLESRHDLDMTRVGFFGQGSGGAIGILAASVEPRIRALDVLAPWGDWPDWFAGATIVPKQERATYVEAAFQAPLQRMDPLNYLPLLTGIPVRAQFLDDSGDPLAAIQKLKNAAPSHATVAEFRSSRQAYQTNSGGKLYEWIAEQLKARPAVQGSPGQ